MVLPFAPIVDRSLGCLISVDVMCDLSRIIMKCADCSYKEQQRPKRSMHGHATRTRVIGRSKSQTSLEA